MARNDLPTKKVVLFIVEGITDKTSIGLILSKIITSNSVFFAITDGDICYKDGVTSPNAISAVSGTYLETWRYIMDGTNSLKRKCNFGLFFLD